MTAAEMAELAERFAGGLKKEQLALLPGLCRAAEADLVRRLRPDAVDYEEALGYAAAWMALAQLRSVSGEPVQFKAGDFSVSRSAAGDLREMAIALLRPWLEADIVFQKV